MFFSRGFTATSVDAIAADAGYTTGAVYSNFGGKADLFLAVLEEATAKDLDVVRRALDEAVTDEHRLAVFTAAITGDPTRWQARVVATFEFLSYARRHPELRARLLEAQRAADAAVAELVAAVCVALGVEPGDSVEELARDINAVVNGLAIRALFDDEVDMARAVSTALNSLLTGDRSDLRALRGGEASVR
jgi:AcrR family transcriptional regulator